jgi:hypothetical protein
MGKIAMKKAKVRKRCHSCGQDVERVYEHDGSKLCKDCKGIQGDEDTLNDNTLFDSITG